MIPSRRIGLLTIIGWVNCVKIGCVQGSNVSSGNLSNSFVGPGYYVQRLYNGSELVWTLSRSTQSGNYRANNRLYREFDFTSHTAQSSKKVWLLSLHLTRQNLNEQSMFALQTLLLRRVSFFVAALWWQYTHHRDFQGIMVQTTVCVADPLRTSNIFIPSLRVWFTVWRLACFRTKVPMALEIY